MSCCWDLNFRKDNIKYMVLILRKERGKKQKIALWLSFWNAPRETARERPANLLSTKRRGSDNLPWFSAWLERTAPLPMSDRDQPSLEPSSVKKEHKHHHKSKKHAEGKEHERHSTRRSTKHADSSAKKVNHEKTNAKPDDGLKEIPFGPEPETSWPPKNWHLLDQALTQLEYYQKYGPVYGVKIMGNNFYVIADPDLVREIGADSTMWGKSGSKESPIFSQWHNIRGNCGISVIDGN